MLKSKIKFNLLRLSKILSINILIYLFIYEDKRILFK